MSCCTSSCSWPFSITCTSIKAGESALEYREGKTLDSCLLAWSSLGNNQHCSKTTNILTQVQTLDLICQLVRTFAHFYYVMKKGLLNMSFACISTLYVLVILQLTHSRVLYCIYEYLYALTTLLPPLGSIKLHSCSGVLLKVHLCVCRAWV